MTHLNRCIISWSGTAVTGPSATVLHFSASDNSAPPVAALRTAFNAAASLFPSGMTLSFPVSGDVIDDTNGALVGVWSGSAASDVGGSSVGTTVMGVGACISWYTGGIVSGTKGPRKLRGRTFLVPVAANVWDNGGKFGPGTVTQLETLASAIQASGPLAVWHRPTTKGGTDGNSYGVISHRIHNKPAVLRSRRD